MKTAYELAMERLGKSSPSVKLTNQQRKELADLDAKYAAKIAAREIALKSEINAASAGGDLEKAETLSQQLIRERKALQTELDSKKDVVRGNR